MLLMIWPCLPIALPVSAGLTEIEMLPGWEEIRRESGSDKRGLIRKVRKSSMFLRLIFLLWAWVWHLWRARYDSLDG